MSQRRFAPCIENEECEDLEKRKVYQIKLDEAAVKERYLRVVDESGEDYLYPDSCFILVKLPRKAEDALLLIGGGFTFGIFRDQTGLLPKSAF